MYKILNYKYIHIVSISVAMFAIAATIADYFIQDYVNSLYLSVTKQGYGVASLYSHQFIFHFIIYALLVVSFITTSIFLFKSPKGLDESEKLYIGRRRGITTLGFSFLLGLVVSAYLYFISNESGILPSPSQMERHTPIQYSIMWNTYILPLTQIGYAVLLFILSAVKLTINLIKNRKLKKALAS